MVAMDIPLAAGVEEAGWHVENPFGNEPATPRPCESGRKLDRGERPVDARRTARVKSSDRTLLVS